jgi:hypothetical protein
MLAAASSSSAHEAGSAPTPLVIARENSTTERLRFASKRRDVRLLRRKQLVKRTDLLEE